MLQGEVNVTRPALYANQFTNHPHVYSRTQTSTIIGQHCDISREGVTVNDFFTPDNISVIESFSFRKSSQMVQLSVEPSNQYLKKKINYGNKTDLSWHCSGQPLSSLV